MKWIKEVDPVVGAVSYLDYQLGENVHRLRIERVPGYASEFSITIDEKWMCEIPDSMARPSARRKYAYLQMLSLAAKYGKLAKELAAAKEELMQ